MAASPDAAGGFHVTLTGKSNVDSSLDPAFAGAGQPRQCGPAAPGPQASGEAGAACASTAPATTTSYPGANAGTAAYGNLQPRSAYDRGRELDAGRHPACGTDANQGRSGNSTGYERAGSDPSRAWACARCAGRSTQRVAL